MSYHLVVTVNYPDGGEKEISCHPKTLYNLKRIIGDFIQDSRGGASSFVFTVVEQEEKDGGSPDTRLHQDGE
jgi:hypothetical protein